MNEDNIKSPELMNPQELLEELSKFALHYRSNKESTAHAEMVLSEVRRRLTPTQGTVHNNAPTRSLEMCLNTVIPLQHPDPLSVLFDHINLMAQNTRMLSADTFSKVTASIQSMRCFSDVLDFRHTLMNQSVFLTITDEGHVSVGYRNSGMGMLSGMPATMLNAFGAPPYHNMGGVGVTKPGVNQTEPSQPMELARINLADIIRVVRDGDKSKLEPAEGFKRVIWPAGSPYPDQVISSLVARHGHARLAELVTWVNEGTAVVDLVLSSAPNEAKLEVSMID